MIVVAIVPMLLIYIVLFGGMAVATNVASEAATFITRNFSLIGIITIAFYFFVLIWECRLVKKDVKCNINILLFIITNLVRSVASMVYMLSVLYASAFTFTHMSIFDTLFLIIDLPLIILPMFAYFIYEKMLEFDPSNVIIVLGSILSTGGSLLGIAILELGEYVMPALNAIF